MFVLQTTLKKVPRLGGLHAPVKFHENWSLMSMILISVVVELWDVWTGGQIQAAW
jgi:hypothetical protein